MAISFVGSYASSYTNTSSQNIGFSNLKDESNSTPTLQENDLVIVGIASNLNSDRSSGDANILVPSGYTGILSHDYRDDLNDINFRTSLKFMGSTPDTSVTLPGSGGSGSNGTAFVIYVFRGVDTSTPLDVAAVQAGGTNTGVADAAAITPTTSGAWIMAVGGYAGAIGSVYTNPSGMSSTTNHFRSAGSSTSFNGVIGAALYTAWTSGAYNPAAFGGGSGSSQNSWSAVTIALRPGVTSTTLTPSLLTNSQSFYGPTISASYALSPGLFTNSQTFYNPVVSAAYSLTPSLYTNSQTFYGPTVSQGEAVLLPGLLTNSQTFYGPTVSSGAATLAPSLLTNGQSFFAASVSASYTLAPGLLTNPQTFYAPSISNGVQTLTPSLFSNSQSFYAPTVTPGAITLFPPFLGPVAAGQKRMARSFTYAFAA